MPAAWSEAAGPDYDSREVSPSGKAFVATFAASPRKACELLRTAHTSKNKDRYHFVHGLNAAFQDEVLDQGKCLPDPALILAGGWADLVLDILLEGGDDAGMLVGMNIAELESDPVSLRYLADVAMLSGVFVLFLANPVFEKTASSNMIKDAKRALQRHICLFRAVWPHRTWLFDLEQSSICTLLGGHLLLAFDMCFKHYFVLYTTVYQVKFAPLDNTFIDLVTYCWLRSAYWHEANSGLSDTYFRMLHTVDRGTRARDILFRRLIPSEEVGQSFLSAITIVLSNEDVVDEELWIILGILLLVLEAWPSQFVETHHDPLLGSVTAACRRQLCSGHAEEEYNVLRFAMFSTQMLLAYGTRYDGPKKHHPLNILLTNAETFYMVPLVTRTLKYAVEKSDSAAQTACRETLGNYIFHLAAAGLPELCKRQPKLASYLQQEWLVALRYLRIMREPPQPASMARLRTLWVQFGELIGLREGAEPPGDVPRFWSGCCNPDCLCNGARLWTSLAHKMRECCGCRSALYCNKRCQEADWLEHRKICPGRHGRRQITQ